MKSNIRLVLVLSLFVFAGTTGASAHDSFGFSINLVTPSYYAAPPVYYAPSPPIYYGPPPVYYSPPPPAVYYSPPPVIYYEETPRHYGPNGYVRYYGPRLRYEPRYSRGRHRRDDDDD